MGRTDAAILDPWVAGHSPKLVCGNGRRDGARVALSVETNGEGRPQGGGSAPKDARRRARPNALRRAAGIDASASCGNGRSSSPQPSTQAMTNLGGALSCRRTTCKATPQPQAPHRERGCPAGLRATRGRVRYSAGPSARQEYRHPVANRCGPLHMRRTPLPCGARYSRNGPAQRGHRPRTGCLAGRQGNPGAGPLG